MIVRQNPRRLHVEGKILQIGMLFDFIRELISQRGFVGLALDRNLAC